MTPIEEIRWLLVNDLAMLTDEQRRALICIIDTNLHGPLIKGGVEAIAHEVVVEETA
jgi:hypothetical protein